MTTFELIGDGIYKVEGEITQEDVKQINEFQARTCLVLQNTKGQSSEIIKQINNDNAYFSVLGGLDYFNKDKYNERTYIERTQSSPNGLAMVLEYFESVESGINPNWTDTQKCMYAYNALATDMEYTYGLKQDILSDGVTERGLNGILYNQLTCAGFAQTFKEMMDRLDINCYYQNQRHVHAFNIVELDGKLRGLDVTWDCTKRDDERCSFKNFGRKSNFYREYGHQIGNDAEETVFDLTPFTDEEFRSNYAVIENSISKRERVNCPFKSYSRDRKKDFLPVDKFKDELEAEKIAIIKLRLLKQYNVLPKEMDEMLDATRSRYGFIADYIGTNSSRDPLSEIGQRIGENLIMRDNQILLVAYQNGTRIVEPLSQEQIQSIAPELLGDIKNFYEEYFKKVSPSFDSLLETHSTVENVPAELSNKTATLRTHLGTQISLLANGERFFKQLDIPEEDTERVCGKAKSYMNDSQKDIVSQHRTQHEYDLDYLYAIVQNDVIDTMIIGSEYTEDNLTKLMSDVRTNWKDSRFTDDEFKTLLDEVLDKTMTSEDISRSTINLGIGLDDVRTVLKEIEKHQSKDLQPKNQGKSPEIDISD